MFPIDGSNTAGYDCLPLDNDRRIEYKDGRHLVSLMARYAASLIQIVIRNLLPVHQTEFCRRTSGEIFLRTCIARYHHRRGTLAFPRPFRREYSPRTKCQLLEQRSFSEAPVTCTHPHPCVGMSPSLPPAQTEKRAQSQQSSKLILYTEQRISLMRLDNGNHYYWASNPCAHISFHV